MPGMPEAPFPGDNMLKPPTIVGVKVKIGAGVEEGVSEFVEDRLGLGLGVRVGTSVPVKVGSGVAEGVAVGVVDGPGLGVLSGVAVAVGVIVPEITGEVEETLGVLGETGVMAGFEPVKLHQLPLSARIDADEVRASTCQ